jgi:hypothetical protein
MEWKVVIEERRVEKKAHIMIAAFLLDKLLCDYIARAKKNSGGGTLSDEGSPNKSRAVGEQR